MLLNELLLQIPGLGATIIPDIEIEGVAYDSRQVKARDLFVAMRGQKSDGRRFIAQAAERGAAAVAVEDDAEPPRDLPVVKVRDAREFLALAARAFYGDPSRRLRLVGITGTNGKTTTSYLVDSVLRHGGHLACVVGTTGMRIGDEQFPCARTTPESPDLLHFLRQAVDRGCTHGALEVSSHALALKRVFGTRFLVGVFMNLTQDHLDFHGDMESYYQAKRLLFVPAGGNMVETAVVNVDDAYGRRLANEAGCKVLRFGFGEDADIRVREQRHRADGTDIRVSTPRGPVSMHMRLLGGPNVYNALAAIGAGMGLDVSLDEVRLGIEALEGVPGRMEPVRAGQKFLVLVDYAHTPDALEKMLSTARGLPHARLITVFGCGGDRDRGKRPLMGEIAARMSDYVLATSDNPRTEDPLGILAEIEAGLKRGPAPYELVPDRREAIGRGVARAGEGDVLVIAGKGHETYQVIGAEVIPFDDRLVARGFITKLLSGGKART